MDDGMTRFVMSYHLPLLFFEDHRFSFFAETNFVAGGLQVEESDLAGILLGAQERRFVDEVCQIGAGEAGGSLRDDIQSGVFLQDRSAFGVCLEDGSPALAVRIRNINLAIKSTGPNESIIKILRTVGGGDDHNSLAALESIHGAFSC